MANYEYDVITVGGGLGGAAVAKVLAEKGFRVLVAERERQFKDRIRGEWMAPWGVAEMRQLGLYDLLLATCAHEQPFHQIAGLGEARDLRATTPCKLPALTFSHPAMQEVVLGAAAAAGAEVRRGVNVRNVRPGHPATVTIEEDGSLREITTRMVVCADGRSSMGRGWGGFEVHRAPQRLLGAGLMFENMGIRDDSNLIVTFPGIQRAVFLFPQGGGRVRGYIVYRPQEIERLQGMGDADRFIDECVRSGVPGESFAGVRTVGPLASFDMTETWVDSPWREGLALVGDAAASTDPTWGQGLSLTARDARVLTEKLVTVEDWDVAGRAYAAEHDRYAHSMLAAHSWLFDLFYVAGPEADARRARALPLMMADRSRVPDHNVSGPECPSDEPARRRFFGEA